MSDFFIQNRTNPSSYPQRHSALSQNVTSGRTGYPGKINELTPEEFGALARLAMRGSDILSGRFDPIWKGAKIPPDHIFIPKQGFFGSNIVIYRNLENNATTYQVYWDARVNDADIVQSRDGYPAASNIDIDTAKMATYNSLEDLIDAINTRTFPKRGIGDDIKKTLQQRGYVRGDRIAENELVFTETAENRLLSATEQADMWSIIRISYNNRPDADKRIILREAMVRLGYNLIEKIFTTNNSPNIAASNKKTAAALIMELWKDSKELRNTPRYAWEETYDNDVLRWVAELDKDAMTEYLRKEAEAIMERLRDTLTDPNISSEEKENRLKEAEEALRKLREEAKDNGITLDTDTQASELEDYKKLLEKYKEAEKKIKAAKNETDYDSALQTGKDNLDAVVNTPPNKYPTDAPIREYAESLKRELGKILKPTPQPENLASVRSAFETRYVNQYRDVLISIGKLGGDSEKATANALLTRYRALATHLNTLRNDTAKRAAIDTLENEICQLLQMSPPERGQR